MTKVLILDQSKSVRNILRERLEYEGFSAEAVENEAAASALCERIPFDVILSDTECKVPDAGIPFIALSADTSIDTAVKAVRNGAQDFLTKPIDMNRLLQSLHRTIDNPAPAQAKVLRALQESRISRVGSDRDIEVNVRVVAATNKNLREEIQKGNFREDLYHRLAVIVVRVPPLREHAGDIPALVEHFIRTIASEYGSAPKPIDADALAELQRMPWSGNIRELRNVIERLIILSGDRITARDVKEYC